jgi:DNA-binding NtrC family response regulator
MNHPYIRCALIDYSLPDMNGAELIKHIKRIRPYIEIIATTGVGDRKATAELMRSGASYFLDKPANNIDAELPSLVKECIEKSIENERIHNIRQEMIFSHSGKIHKIVRQIEKWSKHNVPILITGESGTGKELVARVIHSLSPGKDEPFIAVNCGAIPKDLVESELFGYADGAFTSAKKGGNIGKFESAHNGTIFLDEIGELPLDSQVSLLRVLQEKEITLVGGNKSRKIDVRILCATNRNLKEMVEKKEFREDLYYRFGSFIIELPPLRERRNDIPLLVEHFIKQCSFEQNKTIKGINPDVLYGYSKEIPTF